ncbi:c-type cytochrome [Derxia lacustris]|uniref:c-type cytochrome n=1 Tax=Derxia lacustris TaxID=764842 RepID=UPI000A173182|nr:hypothetical protein [Derxia lacustris]
MKRSSLRVAMALLAGLAGPALLPSAALAGELSPGANYLLRCAGCHGIEGHGAPESGIPPFPGLVDPFYRDAQGRTYLLHVPGVVSSSLSAQEIAAVLNYIAARWAKAPAGIARFDAAEVSQRMAEPVADVVAFRRGLVEKYRAAGVEVAPYPWP